MSGAQIVVVGSIRNLDEILINYSKSATLEGSTIIWDQTAPRGFLKL